jgi:hypothetical protein
MVVMIKNFILLNHFGLLDLDHEAHQKYLSLFYRQGHYQGNTVWQSGPQIRELCILIK